MDERYYIPIAVLSGIAGGLANDFLMNYYSICPEKFDERGAIDIAVGACVGIASPFLAESGARLGSRIYNFCSSRFRRKNSGKVKTLERNLSS